MQGKPLADNPPPKKKKKEEEENEDNRRTSARLTLVKMTACDDNVTVIGFRFILLLLLF